MLFKKPGSAIGRLSAAVSPAGGGAGGGAYLAVSNSEDSSLCDYPLGIEPGDLILSLAGGTSSIATPAGFTAIRQTQDTNMTAFARASYKIGTGTEPGNASIASGASFHSLLVFRNHAGIGGDGGGSTLDTGGATLDLPAVGSYQERPSLFAYGASRDISKITGDSPSGSSIDMRGVPVVPYQYSTNEVNAAFTPVPVDFDPGAADPGGFRIALASTGSIAIVAVQVLSR